MRERRNLRAATPSFSPAALLGLVLALALTAASSWAAGAEVLRWPRFTPLLMPSDLPQPSAAPTPQVALELALDQALASHGEGGVEAQVRWVALELALGRDRDAYEDATRFQKKAPDRRLTFLRAAATLALAEAEPDPLAARDRLESALDLLAQVQGEEGYAVAVAYGYAWISCELGQVDRVDSLLTHPLVPASYQHALRQRVLQTGRGERAGWERDVFHALERGDLQEAQALARVRPWNTIMMLHDRVDRIRASALSGNDSMRRLSMAEIDEVLRQLQPAEELVTGIRHRLEGTSRLADVSDGAELDEVRGFETEFARYEALMSKGRLADALPTSLTLLDRADSLGLVYRAAQIAWGRFYALSVDQSVPADDLLAAAKALHRFARALRDPGYLWVAYDALSMAHWRRGELQETLEISRIYREHEERHGFRRSRSRHASAMAKAFAGDLEAALLDWNVSYVRARRLGAGLESASQLQNLAYAHYGRGDFPRALRYAREAKAAVEQLRQGPEDQDAPRLRRIDSMAALILGAAVRPPTQSSLATLKAAVDSCEARGAIRAGLTGRMMWGELLVSRDPDASLFQARQARQRAQTDAPDLLWRSWALEGKASLAAGRRGEALLAFEQALREAERMRERLDDSVLRSIVLPSAADLVTQHVDLLLEDGRIADAYAIAERARAREVGPGGSSPPPATIESLQTGLAAGSILFQFRSEKNHVHLWTVTSESVRHRVLSETPQRLRDLVDAFVNSRGRDRRRGSALVELLFGPDQDLLISATHLMIVPSGAIRSLPVALLPRGPERIVDRLVVSWHITGGSGTLRPPAALTQAGLLGVGFGGPHAALPFAEIEAEALVRDWGRGLSLVGPEATADAVQDHLPDFDLLHLACHAGFDQYGLPYLELRDGTGSGASRSTRRDLQTWPWDGVELVTLSACETAVSGGDGAFVGVPGLSGAILQGGARAVIASLWEVDDTRLLPFMAEFYGGLKDGLATAEALRRAQRLFSAEPEIGGAFVVYGR